MNVFNVVVLNYAEYIRRWECQQRGPHPRKLAHAVVETPLVAPHPVLTVVFAKDRISISFGCDDSREYGYISRNRLAAGICY